MSLPLALYLSHEWYMPAHVPINWRGGAQASLAQKALLGNSIHATSLRVPSTFKGQDLTAHLLPGCWLGHQNKNAVGTPKVIVTINQGRCNPLNVVDDYIYEHLCPQNFSNHGYVRDEKESGVPGVTW